MGRSYVCYTTYPLTTFFSLFFSFLFFSFLFFFCFVLSEVADRETAVAHHFDLKNIKGKLYPVVGMKKKDDHILANFGQMPFQFDIDGYMKVRE
jgi:hypothetical protein